MSWVFRAGGWGAPAPLNGPCGRWLQVPSESKAFVVAARAKLTGFHFKTTVCFLVGSNEFYCSLCPRSESPCSRMWASRYSGSRAQLTSPALQSVTTLPGKRTNMVSRHSPRLQLLDLFCKLFSSCHFSGDPSNEVWCINNGMGILKKHSFLLKPY